MEACITRGGYEVDDARASIAPASCRPSGTIARQAVRLDLLRAACLTHHSPLPCPSHLRSLVLVLFLLVLLSACLVRVLVILVFVFARLVACQIALAQLDAKPRGCGGDAIATVLALMPLPTSAQGLHLARLASYQGRLALSYRSSCPSSGRQAPRSILPAQACSLNFSAPFARDRRLS